MGMAGRRRPWAVKEQVAAAREGKQEPTMENLVGEKKKMEKRSNGDGFVRWDIPQRRERRDLPLGGGGCR